MKNVIERMPNYYYNLQHERKYRIATTNSGNGRSVISARVKGYKHYTS